VIVSINNVGHGSIKFENEYYGSSGVIHLQYTGYPKIVLKELQILFKKALEQKRDSDASWLSAEYINIFRKEGDEISVPSDNSIDVDYSYIIQCNDDEWKVEYTHHDGRTSGWIIVNFLEVVVYDNDSEFWQDCNKKRNFLINKDTISDSINLKREISKMKENNFLFRTLTTLFTKSLEDSKFLEAFNKHLKLIELKKPALAQKFKPFIENLTKKSFRELAIKNRPKINNSKIDGKTAKQWFKNGVGAFISGNYEKMISCVEKTLEIDPLYEGAWDSLGMVYHQKVGNYQKAIDCYEKGVKLYPKSKESWNNMAIIYGELGNEEKKISCYEKLIELDPDDWKALFILGQSYLKTDKDKGVEYGVKAIQAAYNKLSDEELEKMGFKKKP